MVKSCEIIEDHIDEINLSSLVFYFWFKSKFPKGSTLLELSTEFYKCERQISRYLSQLNKAGLIEIIDSYSRIYKPVHPEMSQL